MKKGLFYAMLASLFLGVGTVVISQAGRLMNMVLFSAFAPVIAIPFLYGIAIRQGVRLDIKTCFKKLKQDLYEMILTRAWLGNYLVIIGVGMTLASRAGFLMRAEPAFVALIGYFLFHSKLGRRGAALIGLVVFGSFLLISQGNLALLTSSYSYGDFLVLLGVFFYAYSYFPSSRLTKKGGGLKVVLISTIAAAALLPIILLFFWQDLPIVIQNFQYVIVYSLLVFVAGFYFWFKAFETAEEWEVATVISLSAVVTALTAYLWVGEVLTPIQLAGAAVIMGASYLISQEN